MYLVIGASGRLGSTVTSKLLDAGEQVKAHSRDPGTKLSALTDRGAVPVTGDLREPGWLDEAMDGVKQVLIASHGLVPPSRTNHVGTVDEPGNKRIIDAARTAGVEHIVFMSSTLASPDFPCRFIRAKFGTEQELKESGVGYTILRAPVFIEAHAIVMLGEPLRFGQTVQFFGKGETPLNWISVEDVASCVMSAFQDPQQRNTTRHIGGPDVLTRVQVLEMIETQTGLRAKRRHMPLTLMRVMRTVTKAIHPGLSDLISFAVAEETMPEHPGFAPTKLDWVGTETVEAVVRSWVSAQQPATVAAD